MAGSEGQHGLERLRRVRGVPERDLSLRGAMAAQAAALRKHARAVGGLAGAWEAVVPAELAEKTELVGLSRGVLTVRVADAGTKFLLDRFLRGGGEGELVKRAPTALRRVKLVL